MILGVQEWWKAYRQVQQDCQQDPVLLVVSATSVDAVCASRIWTYWLRADGISYELLAVNRWSQIQQRLKNQQDGAAYGACVLFNMGATVNLHKKFPQAPCKIFCMDGRRPVHLSNVHANEQIVVFMEEALDQTNLPSDGDNLSGNETSSSEDDDDESDEDDLQDSDDESNKDEQNEDEGEHEFEDSEQQLDAGNRAPEEEPQADYDGEDEMEHGTSGKRTKKKRRKQLGGEEDDDGSTSDPLNVTAATIDTAMTDATETTMNDDDDEEEQEDNDGNAQESQESGIIGTQQTTATAMSHRDKYRERRQRLRQYYAGGTFYASPSSFVAWHMCTESRFSKEANLLWLAVMGVSSAFLYHQLDTTGYMQLALKLRDSCQLLFPNDMYDRVTHQTIYAEHLTSSLATTRTKINVSDNGRILSEPDFRFFLLRHDGLYKAILQSDYISTKLQLTTKAGILKLHEWLAVMGYPLDDCKQPFNLMKPSLRRNLQERVRETAPDYGLEELEYTGFFRVTGFQSLLSAADGAHAVAALLALPPPGEAHGEKHDTTGNEKEQDPLQKSFQSAFDALNYQDGAGNNMASLVNSSLESQTATTGIAGGLRMASYMQQKIQEQAASLMERRAITRLTHFRYAYISRNNNHADTGNDATMSMTSALSAEFRMFAQPLVLTRLAHYLMDWHRASEEWTGPKARPLILCAQDPCTGAYTVVGQEYPEQAGLLTRNRLGETFRLAAESLNEVNNNRQHQDSEEGEENWKESATVNLDYSFDSHIVQVEGSHVQRFIEQLHYLMDSSQYDSD